MLGEIAISACLPLEGGELRAQAWMTRRSRMRRLVT